MIMFRWIKTRAMLRHLQLPLAHVSCGGQLQVRRGSRTGNTHLPLVNADHMTSIPASDWSKLYIGRAEHMGGVFPGTLVPTLGVAHIPWGGVNYEKKAYQVRVIHYH